VHVKVGDQAQVIVGFGPEEVEAYVGLGGARPTSGFAPEGLVCAVFSRLLGTDLPGPGANYLKQSTRFSAAPPLGELLSFTVEVTRVRPDKSLIDLQTCCAGADGRSVAEGRALIYVGDRPVVASPHTQLQKETRP
jgi:3-hydroxybutyryl-CoA dehydratase